MNWISITETQQMPKDGQENLLIWAEWHSGTTQEDYQEGSDCYIAKFEDGDFLVRTKAGAWEKHDDNVTHWLAVAAPEN